MNSDRVVVLDLAHIKYSSSSSASSVHRKKSSSKKKSRVVPTPNVQNQNSDSELPQG